MLGDRVYGQSTVHLSEYTVLILSKRSLYRNTRSSNTSKQILSYSMHDRTCDRFLFNIAAKCFLCCYER